MKVGPVIILVLFTFNISHSQARNRQLGSSAQSSITVTATVESSVWLIMEPDGKRDVVVANAPDSRESFSHTPAKAHRRSVAAEKSIATHSKSMQNEMDGAVQFTFPIPKQFDVSKQTVMMDVSESGKTVRRPVVVTTVVPQ